MMKFIMKLMNIVKQRPGSFASDIKRYIDIPVMCCFEFGFPNLLSVLKQFPDIFILYRDLPSSKDNYKVKLNPDCFCKY